MQMKDKLKGILEDLIEEAKDKDPSLNAKKIASMIDIPYPTFMKYLNGDYTCSLDNLVSIAKFFNVSTDYLLGLSEDKTADKDEQTAIAVTGLNEQAISYLKRLTQGQKTALTFLLGRIDFVDILELFQQAKKMQVFLPHSNQAIFDNTSVAAADIKILEPLSNESIAHHYKAAINELNMFLPQLQDISVILSLTGLEPVFKQTISEHLIKSFDEYRELESK